MGVKIKPLLISFLVISFFTTFLPAQQYRLDKSFGQGGVVRHDNAAGGNGDDTGNAVAVHPMGRIYVTGTSFSGTFNALTVWCFQENGQLDTTYNGNGITYEVSGGPGQQCGYAVNVFEDNRILAAGEGYQSDNDFALYKYLPDGSYDSTFNAMGTPGFNLWNYGGTEIASDMALRPGGSIFVCGRNFGTDYQMMLTCFIAGGSGLDGTFNSTPIVESNTAGGAGGDYGNAVCVNPRNGNVYVAGRSMNASANDDMVVWRYNNSGGSLGPLIHDGANGANSTDEAFDILVDNQDNLVITGFSDNVSGIKMVLWRYLPSGTLDTGFNGKGFFTDNLYMLSMGRSLALDSKGRIIVAGAIAENIALSKMALWRFLPDGHLDTAFGNNGRLVYDDPDEPDLQTAAFGLFIDKSDNIYVTGQYENSSLGNNDMGLWKFKPVSEVITFEDKHISLSANQFLIGDKINIYIGNLQKTFQNQSINLRLSIHNIKGDEIRELNNGSISRDSLSRFEWDGRNNDNTYMGAGVYLIRARLNNIIETEKVFFIP